MAAEKILVLGSSNVDLIIKVPRFHGAGETIIGENLVTAYGGKGANQAIAALRLGGNVSFITKLGNDGFGLDYRRYLIRSGLNPRYLLGHSGLPTGVALVEVGPGGENRIIVSSGANASLSIRDLKNISAAWNGVRVFITQLEIPLGTVETGLRTARRRSALTVLNPSPVTVLPADILARVDWLVLNEEEAARLAGRTVRTKADLPKIAERLMKRGVGNVVITRGARGVFFKNRGEEIRLKAYAVKAVDTTAAGDAFIGALACGLAEAKPIREALNMANAAAALATTKFGAQPSLPARAELRKFTRPKK